ncbi:hypothetical protein GCM10017708_32260 [Arthrobacter citreus]
MRARRNGGGQGIGKGRLPGTVNTVHGREDASGRIHAGQAGSKGSQERCPPVRRGCPRRCRKRAAAIA